MDGKISQFLKMQHDLAAFLCFSISYHKRHPIDSGNYPLCRKFSNFPKVSSTKKRTS